jgi:hypothetical protein
MREREREMRERERARERLGFRVYQQLLVSPNAIFA